MKLDKMDLLSGSADIGCSDSAYFFPIDEDGLVFSEHTQNICGLNTAAAYVWCLLADKTPLTEITDALSELCQISNEQSQEVLFSLLQQWCDLALLKGSETIQKKKSYAASINQGNVSSAEAALWLDYDESSFVSEHYYRLLGSLIRLRFSSKDQATWVQPVLAHLQEVNPDGSLTSQSSVTATIDVLMQRETNPGEKNYCLCRRDTGYLWTFDGLDKLAPLVKGLLLQAAINNHDYLLNIHAGVAGTGRQCILLPAAAGSGKTSLTAALVNAGYYYFSDEIALLDEGTFCVSAVPISLCVKEPGITVLQSYYPQLDALPAHTREDGKIVRYLPPQQDRLWPKLEQSVAVAAIIFPNYSPSATTVMKKMNKVDALNRLFAECMVLTKKLDNNKVADLVRWINTVDCFELPFCSLDQAVDLIKSDYPQSIRPDALT